MPAPQTSRSASASRPGLVAGYVKASDGANAEESGLLAALVADPEVLAVVRERYATWQDRVVTEGGDPVEATVARPAADGLWLADLLGMAPPRGNCASVYRRGCSSSAIDWSVNAVGSPPGIAG